MSHAVTVMRRALDWLDGWYETLRIPRSTRRWLAEWEFDEADFVEVERHSFGEDSDHE